MAIPKDIWVERVPMDSYKKGAGGEVGFALHPRGKNTYRRLVHVHQYPGNGILLD